MRKIVYVVGGLLYPNGMCHVLSQKVNYLAENTDYEVYMILTEKKGAPWHYTISDKVKWVNFDINFDELDTMPLYKKVFAYMVKQYRYKRMFTDYLMKVKPDITVSTVRREINFINDIPDGSKKVGEVHFNQSNYRLFEKKYLPSVVNRLITKKWRSSLNKQIRRLDRFVVLTHEDYACWEGMDNMEVIPNALSFFPDVVSECTNKRVIAAGRYTWQKGFDILIDVWDIVNRRHPDWHLDIYGDGDRTAYIQKVRSKGLEQAITCHPAVNDIYARYQESSIFVLSSRYEGFGLVIAEAMSAGLPVVSFACPCGPTDIITDNEDGMLVQNGNIEKMAQSICWLIENDEKRKEYGRQGQINARRYSEESVMKKWVSLFSGLLGD